MAEEIQKKKISELPFAVYLSDEDVMPVVQGSGSSEATKKVDIGLVGSTVAESKTFSNLDTTSKTLVGAINEVNSSIGNVPSADEISYDNTSSGLSASDVQGAIDEIAQGGSGGSTVTVTQIQSTGTKIATITVDSVDTDLYSPNGGGGASTFEDLTDVDIDSSTLANGQVPVYNSNSAKWENGTISGAGGHTIVDDSGTSLTQRTKLQFNGAYSEDNATDNTTEVNVVREMTKAEFDELTEAEKTGFINITDITSGNDDRFQPVIYSEEEREIGVWIDGKPLYEKTIDFGALPNNTTKLVPHNISNLGMIAFFNGVAYKSGDTIPIPFSHSSNVSNQPQLSIGNINITIKTANDQSDRIGYITVRYTKTTDAAGSGQWTPQGVPAVHYSTDEQVVGTWIDGSTIYEKTIIEKNINYQTTGADYTLDTISNVGEIVEITGTITNSAKTIKHELPYVNDTSKVTAVRLDIPSGEIRLRSFDTWSSLDVIATIRYTKSST